jgi:predicted CopG family antitoxin
MHRNITIDEKAYNLLASLKTDSRDSFTKVILRHVRKPAETCGELLESMHGFVPDVDLQVLDKVTKGRGRRAKRA